jgi:membrane-bound lytic murein transglycosylase D
VWLVALAAALAGCRSAPPPPAPAVAVPVPASPASQPARDGATEHFQRGKSFALAGEADCARLEFLEALETFRQGSRADDPDDLLFAGQLWESVRLYQPLTDKSESSDRPPAEDPRDSLVATAPASTPEEVEAAKQEVAAGPARLTFDIPVVVNEPVLKAVAFYQFRTPQAFAGALKRSGRYLDLMRGILKDEGLPQDLVYVAMVESAFKHSAHSRAAAHGFWQFIAGTGRRYGLKKTHSFDERSDPVKSTRAAARYFRDLYEMFGDWHLAMAAYDAGEGKILRGLQRTGAHDYWELRSGGMFLHRETRDYVPYVLAAALISKDPYRFGFDVVPDPPISWGTVRLTKPLDLARVAEAAGVQLAELRALNSELTTRFTPHGVGAYELRVPPGSPALLAARLGSMPAAPDIAEKRIIVKRGDTLQKVAARARVTVAELRDFNDLPGNAKLKRGTVLVVPARRPAKTTRQPTVAAKAPEGAAPGAEVASIAPRAQGEIRALPTTASKITQPSDVGPFASTASSAPAAIPAKRVEIPAEGFVDEPAAVPARKSVKYTVRPGDTLYRIATKFRTSVGALRHANAMDPDDTLKVGQRLTVR